jgi:GTP cyclohydrolase II
MKNAILPTSMDFSYLENKITRIPSEGGAIYLVGPIHLPVNLFGKTIEFKWYSWLHCKEDIKDMKDMMNKLSSSKLSEYQQSSVLTYGDFQNAVHALVRFHSICHTGDIFGSKRCDCGYQLKHSMQHIVDHGAGALFYLANHEGRGIGLFSKALTYILQENGYDTVDANLKLGFRDDSRNYDEAVNILQSLRTKPVTLLTNNPKKLEALKRAGMHVEGRLQLWGDMSQYNRHYLNTKIERSGHLNYEEGSFEHEYA